MRIQLIFEKYQGPRRDLERLFSLLERLLPNEGIQIAANSDIDRDKINFEELVSSRMNVWLANMIGKTKARSVNDLLIEEPFNNFRHEFMRLFDVNQ